MDAEHSDASRYFRRRARRVLGVMSDGTMPTHSSSADSGVYQKAIADFSHAIELNPNDPEGYLDRGLAHLWRGENRVLKLLGRGDYKKAIADFSKAISLDDGNGKAYLVRGIAHFVTNNHKASLSDLNDAIIRSPDAAAAFAWRSYALTMLGRESDAQEDYVRATVLDPRLHARSESERHFNKSIRFAGYDWPSL